jgi:hypothetical protein
MDTLPLAPLPSETRDESRNFRQIDNQGFIDEQVVSGVIARGTYDRTYVKPEGMVLSSSGDDYAGWTLPVASPFREMTDVSHISPAAGRLPGSPSLRKSEELGIGAPYEGAHRWWLFGISGVMTCGIMALTIFSLAQPQHMTGMPPAPISAANRQKTPVIAVKKPAFQPSLTTVLPSER